MEEQKNKTIFRRIRGKIVPIKVAGNPRSGDTRTKKKPSKSFGEKFINTVGFKLTTLGGGIGSIGFGASVAAANAHKKGVFGAMNAFDQADSLRYERIVKISSKAKKISRKFEIIGLGLQGIGAAAGAVEAFVRK